MIEELKSKGVEKLDIVSVMSVLSLHFWVTHEIQVIANAAIMPPDCVGKLSEVSPKVFEETWRVNVGLEGGPVLSSLRRARTYPVKTVGQG